MTMVVEPEDLVLKVAAGAMSQHDALLVLKRLEKEEKKTPENEERFRDLRRDVISAEVLRCIKEGNCSVLVGRKRSEAAAPRQRRKEARGR